MTDIPAPELIIGAMKTNEPGPSKHPLCLGSHDPWNGDFDCEYDVGFSCEDCRFGMAGSNDRRRGLDPRAKCHQSR